MTSKCIYHYVYRITNVVEKKHYYGKRSSKCDPKLDLGIVYFSSSTDKEFRADQKLNPQNYKYKIVQLFETSEEAYIREIELHKLFKVGINSNFYNKTSQTSYGIDNTGIPHSEEHRRKIGLANLGRKHTAEARANMGKGLRLEKLTESHKANIKKISTRKKF